MMLHFWFVAALAVVAPPGNQPPAPLTIEAAVAIALDTHPSVRAAEFGIVAAREHTGVARAAYFPDLNLTGGYARWERHAFLPDGVNSPSIASAIGPTNDWFAGLSGRYLLYDSGERAARVRTALAGEDVASAEATRLRQDLALRVHEAFYGFGAAMQAREVAKQEVLRADEHLRLAEARQAAGAVPGGDVLRARVSATEARLHEVSSEHLVRVAAGRLNTAMGLPAETAVNAVAEASMPSLPAKVDFAAAVERALSARPGLAVAQSRVEVARGNVQSAAGQSGPKLSAEWRAGIRDAIWWPSDRDWSAGITVQWPLFDGRARARAKGRARAELAQAEAGLAADQLNVRREVWDARSRLDESYESALAAVTLVEEAEHSLRVSRERYRAGAGTLTDLLDAEASLARAAATRVQTLLDYQTARATFDWAMGELYRP